MLTAIILAAVLYGCYRLVIYWDRKRVDDLSMWNKYDYELDEHERKIS